MPNDMAPKNEKHEKRQFVCCFSFHCKSIIKTTANDNKRLQSTTNVCCRLYS